MDINELKEAREVVNKIIQTDGRSVKSSGGVGKKKVEALEKLVILADKIINCEGWPEKKDEHVMNLGRTEVPVEENKGYNSGGRSQASQGPQHKRVCKRLFQSAHKGRELCLILKGYRHGFPENQTHGRPVHDSRDHHRSAGVYMAGHVQVPGDRQILCLLFQ